MTVPRHAQIALIPYPKSEREWQHAMRVLSERLGMAWDGTTMIVQDSTEIDSRPDAPVLTILQRIGDDGTGTDSRLNPVSRTSNLGSAIVGSSPLSAEDAGTDATVTGAAFQVQFDFDAPIDVAGFTIPGLAYSTKFFIYLTDFEYDGSYTAALAVTASADLVDAPQNFYVGTITTPAALDPPTGGDGGGGGHYVP
jgi:hypothetical protein